MRRNKTDNHEVYFSNPINNDQEAEWIVADIREKMAAGLSLRDMAVLYRTHSTGRAIFDQLLLSDIPFVTYGKSSESFYQNTFIRPMLSLLRVSTNYMDADSMVEAAPILYISRNEMRDVLDKLSYSYIGDTPKDLVIQALKLIADKKSGYQQRSLITKIEGIKSLSKMTPAQAIREIRKGTIDYERQLELDERKTLSIHKEMIVETLDGCEQASRGFDSVQSFLSFVERVEEKNEEMEELRKQPDIEAVRLMTIHASKGLEFDTVYAIGWCENILPHSVAVENNQKEDSSLSPDQALEEERRLAYVCVTRAKQHLYISSPKFHRNINVKVSRFLFEGIGKTVEEDIYVL